MRKHLLVDTNFRSSNNFKVAVIFVTALSSCVSFYSMSFMSDVARVL